MEFRLEDFVGKDSLAGIKNCTFFKEHGQLAKVKINKNLDIEIKYERSSEQYSLSMKYPTFELYYRLNDEIGKRADENGWGPKSLESKFKFLNRTSTRKKFLEEYKKLFGEDFGIK